MCLSNSFAIASGTQTIAFPQFEWKLSRPFESITFIVKIYITHCFRSFNAFSIRRALRRGRDLNQTDCQQSVRINHLATARPDDLFPNHVEFGDSFFVWLHQISK